MKTNTDCKEQKTDVLLLYVLYGEYGFIFI